MSKSKIKSPRQLIPYSYLIKRSLSISIQVAIIFVIIFFWKEIVNFILNIYGF